MREQIEKYLSTVVNSTAKKISLNIGMPQLDVAHALNKMHADGLVEREKRPGGGNEYTYWLSTAEAKPAVQCNTEPASVGASPTPSAEMVGESKSPITPHLAPGEKVREAAADSAMAALYERVRTLLEVLDLPPTMTLAIEVARERAAAAGNRKDELAVLRNEVASLKDLNERLKANNAQLEQRIDSLSGDVRPVGSVFVTIGRDAKPMRHATIEKAQKRGRSLVSGNRETEVLVLEPIGRIVRGAEWRPRGE
ncbi:delta 1-pyrroline-5-carboxylate dehydrogenase [Burkholderia aenigmatica]|uniref:1-pyrroline-5-carboxylate dehydrogenase n=1 Tax=Burkholderia aenigmatica TaxID=2015348 RepID=UPI00145305A0|nr:1-pyrroline-5-carboxylate dehydrogenase [Burkholderia aenigmatica]VWC53803.1 delta 1-pyrroline-5-carboxylate dehydrogenase [Burkholderia aenigmatica]